MGIVYKVMKHRRGLEMDRVSRQREPQADVDRKFPAEYILQLCKFLAEKSKRNKQQQQMRVSNNHDASFEYEEVDETMETEAQKEAAAVEALALIKHSRLAAIPTPADTRITTTTSSLPPSPSSLPLLATTKPVLVDKVVNTRIQQQHHRPSTPSSCAAQFQRGHKQDILQKIRSQIFERKRQRQLATMQRIGAVWRPW